MAATLPKPSLTTRALEFYEEGRVKDTLSPFARKNSDLIRKDWEDETNPLRPGAIKDIQRIINLPYYNRYQDKTQVFSLVKNDDISHRALHVQLVSTIARNIGRLLRLNTDLIEAIALAHDIGHTPFGHLGEAYLDEELYKHTGRHFCHNAHSARILSTICPVNFSLEVIDGALCHNGEFEKQEISPKPFPTLSTAPNKDKARAAAVNRVEGAISQFATDPQEAQKILPATLEGAVVRICDIIAYLGKDQQDVAKVYRTLGKEPPEYPVSNSQIIISLTADVVNNSSGMGKIRLSKEGFEALKEAKKGNYREIYSQSDLMGQFENVLHPTFTQVYDQILTDIKSGNESSPVFSHHINYLTGLQKAEKRADYRTNYLKNDPNTIACDYLASMTDGYFVSYATHLGIVGPESDRTLQKLDYSWGD